MVDDPAASGDGLAEYAVNEVPFDEWADVDTLLHRTSATSGDFDYVLRPMCPDCGALLEPEYQDLEDGGSVLGSVVCHACRVIWEAGEPEA